MDKRLTPWIFLVVFFSFSCAVVPAVIQPQINGLVVAGRFNAAKELLENNQEAYGPNNRLLYDMDYGLVLHLAGKYKESISFFERAKRAYDQLLTVSLSNQATTWLVNDYLAPYRGEDFERVLINIFQALNFAALRDIENSLVEARDVDSKLRLINSQYPLDQKNVYQEDAFARFLMGILYEAQGNEEGYNDAFISYRKAEAIYEHDFEKNYGVKTPKLLKENLFAAAQWMGKEEFKEYQQRLGSTSFLPLEERSKKSEVYLIHYAGFSPIKNQFSLPIPLPGGYVTQLAFPKYEKRSIAEQQRIFKAVSLEEQEFKIPLEKVHDIGAIAMKSLKDRRVRVIAKAVLRAGGKYFLENKTEEYLKERTGETSAKVFRYLSNIYNITSEQADLRSWQTLPDRIEIARLVLDPGEYEFFIDQKGIKRLFLKAGQKEFIIYRSVE